MIEIRIPLPEPFAYLNVPFEGTADEAWTEFQRLMVLTKGGTGLEPKEFNRVLDRYLWGDGSMEADEYGFMNLDQQSIIQTIKRSRARNKK
jgi:hypothetical protein